MGTKIWDMVFRVFSLIFQYLSVAANAPNHEIPLKIAPQTQDFCTALISKGFGIGGDRWCSRCSPGVHLCNGEGPAAKY